MIPQLAQIASRTRLTRSPVGHSLRTREANRNSARCRHDAIVTPSITRSGANVGSAPWRSAFSEGSGRRERDFQ
jgi:hypothetical protein